MRSLFVGVLLATLLLGVSATASAKVFITHGDTIHEFGIPGGKGIDLKDGGGILRIGFKYNYAGLFFADAWTWGGEYVLYSDTQVILLTRQTAADMLDVDAETLVTPFFYRFPPIPFFLVTLGVPLMTYLRWRRHTSRHREAHLRENASYGKALAIARGDETHSDDDERFDAAVQELTLDGIPEADARRNLKFLLHRSMKPE